MATLIKYGIVNAQGTDGYSLVSVYSDGTESQPYGWYQTVEQAEAEASGDVPIEDWTQSDE
jgi:hypothetical protein